MGGANLEVFKFGFYLFFPIAVMAHFSDPRWYNEHVAPYRAAFWPSPEAVIKPPTSRPEIEAELARIKASRAAQRAHAVSSSTAELDQGRAGLRSSIAVGDEGSMEDKRALTPREVRRERGLDNGVLAGGGLWGGGKEKWV